MTYHVTGLISALTFLLTISGLWSQLQLVWKRKRDFLEDAGKERPTAVLSLNQFVSSFLGFFSFFLYGACLPRFNHYLVWPRLVASILTLMVLFEMMRDRRERFATAAFASCVALLIGSPMLFLAHPAAAAWGRLLSQGLVVVVTIVLAQGYLHQVVLIRQTGRTGAVSLRMHQFFLLKDLATIAFALAMGLAAGWPLLLLSSVSAATKVATIWHFRWARLSALARERREGAGALRPLEMPSIQSPE
jgi:uncharacterized protein with PQ loop repeat